MLLAAVERTLGITERFAGLSADPRNPAFIADAAPAVRGYGTAACARCFAVHNSDGAFSMEDPNTTTGQWLRYQR